MKNTLRLAAGILLAGLLTGTARAGTPDSFTLTVTVGNQLSVKVKDNVGGDLLNYDFGGLALGQASVNTGQINIDNDSGGLVETYQLSVGDSSGNGLILRGTAGALAQDEYRLSALFQDAVPAPNMFGAEDILTSAPQTATDGGSGGRFSTASTAAVQDGAAVADDNRLGNPPTAEVRLWLKLEVSGSSSLSGVQTDFATVYVNAV